MNAFGHAVAASWERDEAPFLLGAMLPDLAGLIGGRVAEPRDELIALGLRHHHRVDDCFHELPGFRDWWREWQAGMESAGLRRHQARAASHVAIELFLDGELARHHAGVHERALGEAREREEPGWRVQPRSSWDELVVRLHEDGAPHHLREASVVTRRTAGALGRRARLRLEPGEEQALGGWLQARVPEAQDRAPLLAEELQAALG